MTENIFTGTQGRECSVGLPGRTTVTELESIFPNKPGIAVRLVRKSDNICLETSITGQWTLNRQNQHGEEIPASQKISIVYFAICLCSVPLFLPLRFHLVFPV